MAVLRILSCVVFGVAGVGCAAGAPRCDVDDVDDLAALGAQGVINCELTIHDSPLESLDDAQGLTSVPAVTLGNNARLRDIDLLEDLDSPFDLYVENTALAAQQNIPALATQVQLIDTGVESLRLAGSAIDYLVLERNRALATLDAPDLATVSTLILVDLPVLAFEGAFAAVTSCASLTVVRVPSASAAAIDALAVRCGASIVEHCGNLDDAPCE